MTITRKQFLALTVTGGLGAMLVPHALFAAGNGNGFDPVQLKKAVGQTFRLTGVGGDGDLVLQSFTDHPNPKTTQFSLSFTAPAGERLAEGTYSMTSKALGKMEIFIVPTGVSNGVPSYRADFNLLAPGK